MKSRLTSVELCIVFCVSIFGLVQANAATTIISVDRETAIFAESPGNNLGAGNLIAGTNAFGGDIARSLLAFNIASAIPSGSHIDSVIFQLGVIRQSNRNAASAYELHRFLTAWTEGNGGLSVNTGSPALAGETTWNSQSHGSILWSAPGTQAGVEYASLASATGAVINSGSTIYSINSAPDLVADVQSWLDNPATNFGWLFKGSSEGTTGTARRFSSTEVPDGSGAGLIPQITVSFTAVPEPSRCLLSSFGMVLLVLRRRR